MDQAELDGYNAIMNAEPIKQDRVSGLCEFTHGPFEECRFCLRHAAYRYQTSQTPHNVSKEYLKNFNIGMHNGLWVRFPNVTILSQTKSGCGHLVHCYAIAVNKGNGERIYLKTDGIFKIRDWVSLSRATLFSGPDAKRLYESDINLFSLKS